MGILSSHTKWSLQANRGKKQEFSKQALLMNEKYDIKRETINQTRNYSFLRSVHTTVYMQTGWKIKAVIRTFLLHDHYVDYNVLNCLLHKTCNVHASCTHCPSKQFENGQFWLVLSCKGTWRLHDACAVQVSWPDEWCKHVTLHILNMQSKCP